mmetsp:Transcript_65485/g.142826  ORF Transcript_65485/g.142826 Transcript_65485/m.142826 type:complete len:1140 (+) Transcript_65485:27-3446(+)
MTPAPMLAGGPFDAALPEVPEGMVGSLIAQHLALKGFCVLSSGFEEGMLHRACKEVEELEAQQRFRSLHPAIREGLLGTEGSATVAELESPDLDAVQTDGEALLDLDDSLTQLAYLLEPHLGLIEVDVRHRSLGVVSQVGELAGAAVVAEPLREVDASKWLSQFVRHQVMVLIFLGPSRGTLEMLPHEDDEAEPHEIQTVPGMVVVLRPDLLGRDHRASGPSAVLSCFLLQGAERRPKCPRLNPSARELDEWISSRLSQLKAEEREALMWDPSMPRELQRAMNHLYHKGRMVGVRSADCRFPGTEAIDSWYHLSLSGPDYVGTVSFLRWDHDELYDPDPESWRDSKSYCRHASFIEGVEMFDSRMFGLSPAEASSMDPNQRLILEVGYSALHSAGLNKKMLMNSNSAVYVGNGLIEWNNLDRKQDYGAFGATGTSLAIGAGRFSFCLGLKGPSLVLDTEASSGLAATYFAAEAVQGTAGSHPCERAVAIGVHLCLSPHWWPAHCAAGWLSRLGRCLTFDASADGYVRGEGCAALVLRSFSDEFDNEVVPAGEDMLGGIAGAAMNCGGASAGLCSPSGPAEQQVAVEATRNAGISPLDVDSVALHGAASCLADAIEVGSSLRVHRGIGRQPLVLSAVKSSVGNQVECGGISSLLLALLAARSASTPPNLHLRQANPDVELRSEAAFATEAMEHFNSATYAGVMSRGFGGSNVCVLAWGKMRADSAANAAGPEKPRPAIAFWPGGGGITQRELRPIDEYAIVGSWSNWAPVVMEPEGDGVYGHSLQLGSRGWEEFQIWLDGEPSRVLHPGTIRASQAQAVLGPEEHAHGLAWLIDSRDELVAVVPEGTEAREAAAGMGLPGSSYRVRLRIAGKWRAVSWERLAQGSLRTLAAPRSELEHLEESPPAAPVPSAQGRCFLSASWQGWVLQEMEPSPDVPGLFSVEVLVERSGGEFQVVRSREASGSLLEKSTIKALAPATLRGWRLEAAPGERCRIEFQKQSGAPGLVSWRCIGHEQLSGSQLAAAPSYWLATGPPGYRSVVPMRLDAGAFQCMMQLDGAGSFVILEDCLWQRALHLSCHGAGPKTFLGFQGPGNVNDLSWTVARQASDGAAAAGQLIEVRLLLNAEGRPKSVQWSPLARQAS